MPRYIRARTPMSRRSVAFLAIGGLHAAFILAFTGAFTGKLTRVEPSTFTADFFPDTKEQLPEPAAPREPDFQKPVITDPIPLPPINEVAEPLVAMTSSNLDSQYGRATAEVPPLPYVRASLAKRFPNPESFYPPSAIRQELEGKALVRVCVGPDGKLAEAPQIARSTQNRLLDDAALRLARAGSYVAGFRDGVAITDCFNFQAKFQLTRASR